MTLEGLRSKMSTEYPIFSYFFKQGLTTISTMSEVLPPSLCFVFFMLVGLKSWVCQGKMLGFLEIIRGYPKKM